MKVVTGKFYRTKRGIVRGPMKFFKFSDQEGQNLFIIKRGDGMCWKEDGTPHPSCSGLSKELDSLLPLTVDKALEDFS